MAAVAPAPSPPTSLARNLVAVTLAYTARSTELSDVAKVELDRLAKDIADRTLRQVELPTMPTMPIRTAARCRWRAHWSCGTT